jgi:hypothetical protein
MHTTAIFFLPKIKNNLNTFLIPIILIEGKTQNNMFIQYFCFFGVTEFQVAADDISLQNIIIKSP